jgi:hypothetical protein
VNTLKALRLALYFVIDSIVASLGVAIFESSLYRLFRQPTDIRGIYEKEFLLSAGIAFILGLFVYWRLIRRTALWVWTVGVVLFVIRVVMGPEESEVVNLLAILSIRMVFYSLGALTCSWTLRGGEKQSAGSRRDLGSLLWILGTPPKLPARMVEAMRSESESVLAEEESGADETEGNGTGGRYSSGSSTSV